MSLLSLFAQASTNKEYLSFEPSEDQALKKIVCSKEKKMRLQEFFKTLPKYLSRDFSEGKLLPRDAIPLKEHITLLYERYKQASNKWPRLFLKTLAKFTPSFLKQFLPACFSNHIEEAEKATEIAYQGCLTALSDAIQGETDFHAWFTTLSEEELCNKFFQKEATDTRFIDRIYPDHLEKKEFIELIKIQRLAQINGFNSAWPPHWTNKPESLQQLESFYLELCEMQNPLEIKKRIFSLPLSSKEQMALLAAIIGEKNVRLINLEMTEEELLALCEHLQYVNLFLFPLDLGQKVIKKLVKPYALSLGSNAAYLQELTSLEKCIDLNCSYCSHLTSLPELPNCKTLNCFHCTSLTSLPELPNCTTLDCSYCPHLNSLPELPNCKTLDCSGCTNLASLPKLPNCTNLDCRGCTNLTSLPELPNCTTLDCTECANLASLPELPNCTTLKCMNCTNLTFIPTLPNCTLIDFRNCHNLTSFLAWSTQFQTFIP